jgi:hypothetical protein
MRPSPMFFLLITLRRWGLNNVDGSFLFYDIPFLCVDNDSLEMGDAGTLMESSLSIGDRGCFYVIATMCRSSGRLKV